jgi:hypothetical protein
MNVFDQREVDDQAVAHTPKPPALCPRLESKRADHFSGRDHIRDVSALCNQTWLAASRGVIDFARFVVAGSAGSISFPRS